MSLPSSHHPPSPATPVPTEQPANPAVTAFTNIPIPSQSYSNLTSTPSALSKGADQFPLAPDIIIIPYEPLLEERYLPAIQQLIAKDLSEPYSIYCYRYFLYQWPSLCFIALDAAGTVIGTVVSKLEEHRGGPMRGYIGMLAVQSEHRSKGLATKLVALSIDAMIDGNADEVALETEVTNTASLKLYERLGFLRSKRLHRYYLNGNSAFRLLLYIKPGTARKPTFPAPAPPADEMGYSDDSMYS